MQDEMFTSQSVTFFWWNQFTKQFIQRVFSDQINAIISVSQL